MKTLCLENMGKDYHERRALRGVNRSFSPSRVAVLGPNGAGKSTLLKILSTQIRPTTGFFSLDALHSKRDLVEIRKKIGTVGHKSFLYNKMSVQENLLFYARLYGVKNPNERVEVCARQFHLLERMDDRVDALSRGFLQRVALARALLHEPELLLLDEPFTGLDQSSNSQLEELLLDWKQNSRLVLFSTHDFEKAATCADRFLMIVKGRVQEDHQGRLSHQDLLQCYEEAIRKKRKRKRNKIEGD